jgi:chromosome segregation ATPase
MRKTFLVLCIVALALLGLNMLPERTATADSSLAIGNLSTIAEELGVEPDEAGKYNLASILEAFYDDHRTTRSLFSRFLLSMDSRVTQLENEAPSGSGSYNNTNLESRVRQLENEVRSGSGSYNNTNLESRVQQLENEVRAASGSNLDFRLRQIEDQLRNSSGRDLDYQLRQMESRIQQIEWALNNLQNQINNCCR